VIDYKKIYSERADDYHRFIAVEDADGNLLQALEHVTSLQGKRLLDIGTGTGRLPLLLASRCRQVLGLDLHRDMLRRHAANRAAAGGRWHLARADMRFLPVRSGTADVVTAAWSISNLRGEYDLRWRAEIGRVIAEMHRACAPGGALIIFETLTTGSLTPAPPTGALAEYYAWLETEWGFSKTTLSTDYQFESVEQAVAWTEFFFGPALSEKIRANGWARLPEWTGMWRLSPVR
jgi:ubiquinone/menaquinone biosynthesis C-methylase UbiE